MYLLEFNQFSLFTDSHIYLNGFPPQILLCLGVTVVTRGQSQLECGDAGWAVVIMTGEEERNLQPDPS